MERVFIEMENTSNRCKNTITFEWTRKIPMGSTCHRKFKTAKPRLFFLLLSLTFQKMVEKVSVFVPIHSKGGFHVKKVSSFEVLREHLRLQLYQLKCLLFKKGQNVEVQVFFTINKKSTIFVQFCSNFQGLIYPLACQTLEI